MKAPNRRNSASKRYRAVVDARVPKKRNSNLHENENDHFYTARVKYVKEAISSMGKKGFLISADNKAKIKIGNDTPATDRHHQIRRFYLTNQGPNYHQHDFPTPGYYATPCGYLIRQTNQPEQQIVDDHGRTHYV